MMNKGTVTIKSKQSIIIPKILRVQPLSWSSGIQKAEVTPLFFLCHLQQMQLVPYTQSSFTSHLLLSLAVTPMGPASTNGLFGFGGLLWASFSWPSPGSNKHEGLQCSGYLTTEKEVHTTLKARCWEAAHYQQQLVESIQINAMKPNGSYVVKRTQVLKLRERLQFRDSTCVEVSFSITQLLFSNSVPIRNWDEEQRVIYWLSLGSSILRLWPPCYPWAEKTQQLVLLVEVGVWVLSSLVCNFR